jgi:uncharacterized protein (DUF2147 family)
MALPPTNKALAATVFVVFGAAAQAQMTPVGTWRSIDDDTRQPKAQIVITDSAGVLTGRIEQLLRPGADLKAVCDRCTDDRKDKPMLGLEIIRGARKAEGKDVWEGGRVLDPEKGSTYALRLTPVDGGQRLEVRGSIGPFGRTQTWQRIK